MTSTVVGEERLTVNTAFVPPDVSVTVISRDPSDGSVEIISDSPTSPGTPRHVTHEIANSIFVNRP